MGEGGGALECNLTGTCSFLKNFHILLMRNICISIPCFGIIRLFPKTIWKIIVYCSLKQQPIVLEQIVMTCFGVSYQFSCSVQEFMLKNDTMKNGTSSIGFKVLGFPPPGRYLTHVLFLNLRYHGQVV